MHGKQSSLQLIMTEMRSVRRSERTLDRKEPNGGRYKNMRLKTKTNWRLNKTDEPTGAAKKIHLLSSFMS